MVSRSLQDSRELPREPEQENVHEDLDIHGDGQEDVTPERVLHHARRRLLECRCRTSSTALQWHRQVIRDDRDLALGGCKSDPVVDL